MLPCWGFTKLHVSLSLVLIQDVARCTSLRRPIDMYLLGACSAGWSAPTLGFSSSLLRMTLIRLLSHFSLSQDPRFFRKRILVDSNSSIRNSNPSIADVEEVEKLIADRVTFEAEEEYLSFRSPTGGVLGASITSQSVIAFCCPILLF